MKTGKISESVLKRSVLKICKTKREEVIRGAGIGEDCAFFAFSEQEYTAVCVHTAAASVKTDMKRALYRCLNNLAVSGARPVSVLLNLTLPEDIFESDLKEYMEQAEAVCKECRIQIAGGHTEVSEKVTEALITVTAVGKANQKDMRQAEDVKPGQDIVLSKWIGLEGTALLAQKREEELVTRYPAYLIEEAKGYEKYLPILPEAAIAIKSGACAMHDASTGGIFSALWELAEGAGVGLDIDLKKLPVKQETVEICEFLNANPYELLSGGCLIMTADNGFDLVNALNQAGISAALVGKVTQGHDRIVRNEDEKRFLERPRTDEAIRILK